LALRVEDGESPEKFVVSGRGELHLGILIETMRREGYEFEISKPEVIIMKDEDTGETMEPFEHVHIEVADSMTGTVVEMMGARRGQMVDMRSERGTTFIEYLVPTRGLLGFRTRFLTATSGMGQMHSLLHGYEPLAGSIPGRQFGSLVAWETGTAATYGMQAVQDRGTYFIEPGTEVYEGMVVGEHIRTEDLAVNVCKTKVLTAVRTIDRSEDVGMRAVRQMTLDDFIEFISDDELLEVTPQNLRARKRTLNNDERIKEVKRRDKMLEAAE
jgi:GTP-binding protein